MPRNLSKEKVVKSENCENKTQCDFCNYQTSYPFAMKKHEILKHFVCLICRKASESIKELKKHQENGSCGTSSHNSYKLQKCENCDHITVGAFINTHYKFCSLRNQIQNQSDVTYGCDKCDQKFKLFASLKAHKSKSHKVPELTDQEKESNKPKIYHVLPRPKPGQWIVRLRKL